MRLYLIRHGETEYNKIGRVQGHGEVPLNDTGVNQIARVSRRLVAETKLDHIYASDVRRAAMSAAILAAQTGAPLSFDPLYRERDPGDHTGQTFDQASAFFTDLSYDPPNGESVPVFLERVQRAFEHLLDREGRTGRHIALVSHGMFCRAFMQVCLRRDPMEVPSWPNASLTICDYNGTGAWEPVLIADASHLAAEDPAAHPTGA